MVALPIFFIPGVYSYFLVSSLSITDLYTIFFLLAATGITIGHYALILVSQAEDQPVDKKMGLLTPAVKWGLYKTIRLSFLLNVIGSILAILALIGLFLLINIWLFILVPLVALGRYFSFKEARGAWTRQPAGRHRPVAKDQPQGQRVAVAARAD